MIQIGAPSATIDTPIEHLMACHRRIEQRLDTLVNAADYVKEELPAAVAAIERSFHFLDTSGVLHTKDEESSLFPRLRPRLSPAELEFVDSLEQQHREADSIYEELRQLAAGLSPDTALRYRACAEKLRALYLAHIRSEDEILTELARRALDPSEIEQIAAEMRTRRTP